MTENAYFFNAKYTTFFDYNKFFCIKKLLGLYDFFLLKFYVIIAKSKSLKKIRNL